MADILGTLAESRIIMKPRRKLDSLLKEDIIKQKKILNTLEKCLKKRSETLIQKTEEFGFVGGLEVFKISGKNYYAFLAVDESGDEKHLSILISDSQTGEAQKVVNLKVIGSVSDVILCPPFDFEKHHILVLFNDSSLITVDYLSSFKVENFEDVLLPYEKNSFRKFHKFDGDHIAFLSSKQIGELNFFNIPEKKVNRRIDFTDEHFGLDTDIRTRRNVMFIHTEPDICPRIVIVSPGVRNKICLVEIGDEEEFDRQTVGVHVMELGNNRSNYPIFFNFQKKWTFYLPIIGNDPTHYYSLVDAKNREVLKEKVSFCRKRVGDFFEIYLYGEEFMLGASYTHYSGRLVIQGKDQVIGKTLMEEYTEEVEYSKLLGKRIGFFKWLVV